MAKIIKVGLDIGNSSVKGSILSEQNGLLKEILSPSCVNPISDARKLSFPDHSTRYIRVLESPLAHYDEIVAIGNRAMEIPNYQEYDVESTSYKTDHEITTSQLFGIIADAAGSESEITVLLAVSVPIVEAKTYHLVEQYKQKLTGDHKIHVFTEKGDYDLVIHIPVVQV